MLDDEILELCDKAILERGELLRQLGAAMAERNQAISERDAAKAEADNVKAELRASSDELEKTNHVADKLRIEIMKMALERARFKKLFKEYEETMGDLLREKSDCSKMALELKEVEAERDRLRTDLVKRTADLEATETAFNSVHAKAERLRDTVKKYESNEEKLKEALGEARIGYLESERMTGKMAEAMEEKLAWAKKELCQEKKNHEIEVAKLNGQLKLTQTALESAQSSLAQKEKQVAELTSLVEELLGSMGISQQE